MRLLNTVILFLKARRTQTKPSSVSRTDIQLRELRFSVRPHGGAKTNETGCVNEAAVTVLHPDESLFDFHYSIHTQAVYNLRFTNLLISLLKINRKK